MTLLEKIFGNLFVRGIILIVILIILLSIIGHLSSISFPTHEINITVSVNERQKDCTGLSCNYYIVTSDNMWFTTLPDVYPRLRPGHTYNVTVRVPMCGEGIYLGSCNNSTGTIISIQGV